MAMHSYCRECGKHFEDDGTTNPPTCGDCVAAADVELEEIQESGDLEDIFEAAMKHPSQGVGRKR